ncbi:MAG: tRNA preQ1(34) S-adenosylmethionine ribosyltransferase-isomerase QueA [Candidatus Anammoxibacter sp.]
MNNLSDFDYNIPKDLIAQQPRTKRDESRLLVFNRNDGTIEHKRFGQITDYLQKGDLLVFNDTKVFPARLIGRKESGGLVEVLLLNETSPYNWNVLIKSSTKPKPGQNIEFNKSTMTGTILNSPSNGKWQMSFSTCTGQFNTQKEFFDNLDRTGKTPLPPYIKREKHDQECDTEDKERYQTVYAKKIGAIAAPTAGLHFTTALLKQIMDKGIQVAFVTLHVGLGTFKTIKANDYSKHVMDSEYYEVSEKAANLIRKAKDEGRRIIGVGTTSCRVLETINKDDNHITPCSGWTNLFIFPPYKFKATNALITNFHQAKTTLLLLVSAFAGKENILRTYEIAMNKGYRFYSYGDSMMIV